MCHSRLAVKKRNVNKIKNAFSLDEFFFFFLLFQNGGGSTGSVSNTDTDTNPPCESDRCLKEKT